MKDVANDDYDFLSDKRNVKEYLMILAKASVNRGITISDASKVIDKDPSTAFFYVNELAKFGILVKKGTKYIIADPVLDRVASLQEFRMLVERKLMTII